MALTFGRVTLDDRGIRRRPRLWFFGKPFDVAWDEITGWSTTEVSLHTGGGTAQFLTHTLEIHTLKGLFFVDGVGSTFMAITDEVKRRLPEKRIESILTTLQRFRDTGR
jgi:hypothetical protein